MAELKTVPTGGSVEAFLSGLEVGRREECRRLLRLMRRATGEEAAMWGPAIVGFGTYHYRYASGREGDWFLAGFSPRKGDLTLYIMAGFEGADALLARLGKPKIGKSCLYLKRLDGLDLDALEELVKASVARLRETFP